MANTVHGSDLEWLVALEEIRELKARRDYAVDNKDWDAYREMHTPDCRLETMGDPIIGNEAATKSLSKFLDGVTSVHHSHSPIIEFQDPDHATGVWSMEDHLYWTNNGKQLWLHGAGFYHEKYVKQNGKWRFSYRAVKRIRVEQADPAEDLVATRK